MNKSWNNHDGNLIHTKNGYDIIFCKKCGFRHIIPIPGEDELTRHCTVLARCHAHGNQRTGRRTWGGEHQVRR